MSVMAAIRNINLFNRDATLVPLLSIFLHALFSTSKYFLPYTYSFVQVDACIYPDEAWRKNGKSINYYCVRILFAMALLFGQG